MKDGDVISYIIIHFESDKHTNIACVRIPPAELSRSVESQKPVMMTAALQLEAVIGPESFPRQLQISHPELIAEDIEVYFLQAI